MINIGTFQKKTRFSEELRKRLTLEISLLSNNAKITDKINRYYINDQIKEIKTTVEIW